MSSGTEFSTKFQFGDHWGFGYRRDRHDFSVRLQHLSNAGIRNSDAKRDRISSCFPPQMM